MREPILITGVAGFIGLHLARRFLADGWPVLGLDNLNDYYDPHLKRARVRELKDQPRFHFQRCDIADRSAVAKLFAAHRFDFVVHLAAQASVRYSLEHPHAYANSNLIGFLNVLEGSAGAAASIWFMPLRLRFTAPISACRCEPPTAPITP